MSDLAGEPGFKSLSGFVAAHGEPHGSSIVCCDDCHVAGKNSCIKPFGIVGARSRPVQGRPIGAVFVQAKQESSSVWCRLVR
jgi:hypothetical protein